jgi:DnaK suppressor protein
MQHHHPGPNADRVQVTLGQTLLLEKWELSRQALSLTAVNTPIPLSAMMNPSDIRQENPMTKPHALDHYRTQLQALHNGLLARLQAQRGGAIGRAEAAAEHFAREQDSSAILQTEHEAEMALDAHEVKELQSIEDALERLNRGEYGDCIDCRCAIPGARLDAQPDAPRCVACQTSHEKKQAVA